jgi:hypothetical protein
MRSADRSLVSRWLLLAAIAVGLVVMHHLPAQHDTDSRSRTAGTSMSVPAIDPASAAEPMPDAGGMGPMMHECLAVASLFAVAALLMVLLLGGVVRWVRRPLLSAAVALARAHDRPPGWGGRPVLASVCVLRV